jgi:hypothetical protein
VVVEVEEDGVREGRERARGGMETKPTVLQIQKRNKRIKRRRRAIKSCITKQHGTEDSASVYQGRSSVLGQRDWIG